MPQFAKLTARNEQSIKMELGALDHAIATLVERRQWIERDLADNRFPTEFTRASLADWSASVKRWVDSVLFTLSTQEHNNRIAELSQKFGR